MAPKISEEIRAAVKAAVSESRGPRWAAIARENGISASSVKAIAREAELWIPATGAEPAGLEAGTDQRRMRARELAERLSVEAFEDAVWIRGRFRRSRAPAALKALVISWAICVDKGVLLEAHLRGEGEESKGAILTLIEQMRLAREHE